MDRHTSHYCFYCSQCGRYVPTDAGNHGFRLCIFCSGRISDLDINHNHDYPEEPYPEYPSQHADQESDIAYALSDTINQFPAASGPRWTGNESRPIFYPANNRDYNNEDDNNQYDYDYNQSSYWGLEDRTAGDWRGRGQRSIGFQGHWSYPARGHVDDAYEEWGQENENDLRNIVVQSQADSNNRNVSIDGRSSASYRSGHMRPEGRRAGPGGQRHVARGRGPVGGRLGYQREVWSARARDEARTRWTDARLTEWSARRDGPWPGPGRTPESARYSGNWAPLRRSLHFRHQRPRHWPHDRRSHASRQHGRFRWARPEDPTSHHNNMAAGWSNDQNVVDDNPPQQRNQNNPSADISTQNQQPSQNQESQQNQQDHSGNHAAGQPPSQLAILREERQRMQHLFRSSDRFYRAVEAMRKVPVGEDQAGAPCTICFDTFSPPETVARLPCGHVFHVPCIETWLCRQQTCPLCRHCLLADDRRRHRPQGY